jgi:hypothetical protein
LGGKNILNNSRLIRNQSLIQDERLAYLIAKVSERNHLSAQGEDISSAKLCETTQIKLDVLDREINILLKNYILLY